LVISLGYPGERKTTLIKSYLLRLAPFVQRNGQRGPYSLFAAIIVPAAVVAPVVLGLRVWAGLSLRDARVRALVPLRSAT